ncbi:MAG: hypothetical protein AB3N23_18390 [Paracoccaceae bacterium]
MRRAVFILAVAYALFFGWTWHDVANSSNDAAGRGMAMGFLTIAMFGTAVFVVPAVILAAMDRGLKWALGLALAPAVLMMVIVYGGVI